MTDEKTEAKVKNLYVGTRIFCLPLVASRSKEKLIKQPLLALVKHRKYFPYY